MYRLITSVLLLTGEIIKCLLNQDMNYNDYRIFKNPIEQTCFIKSKLRKKMVKIGIILR